MSEEYKTKMARAENCEQVIARFREGDDFTGPLKLNFAAKAQHDWLEVVHCYQEALTIYCGLNQQEKAKSLLSDLFDLVQTCDVFVKRRPICTTRDRLDVYHFFEWDGLVKTSSSMVAVD